MKNSNSQENQDPMHTELHDIWPQGRPAPAARAKAHQQLTAAINAAQPEPVVAPTRLADRVSPRRAWPKRIAAVAAAAATIVAAAAISPNTGGDGEPTLSFGSPAAALMSNLATVAAVNPVPGTGDIGHVESIYDGHVEALENPDAGAQNKTYFAPDGTFYQSHDGGQTYETAEALYMTTAEVDAFPTDPAAVPEALDDFADTYPANANLAPDEVSADDRRFTHALSLLWDPRIQPDQRAAIYQWLGTLEMATDAGTSLDALGREGRVLSFDGDEINGIIEVLFDADTGFTLETRWTADTPVLTDDEPLTGATETFVTIERVTELPAEIGS